MLAITRLRQSVGFNWWTLERFGLSPAKLPRRILRRPAPRIFSVSIPKSGTHLLERALCLHPALYRKLIPTVSDGNIDRWRGLDGLLSRLGPGQVIVSHLRFQRGYPEILDRRGTRTIFLVRDPHDIVISQVHYVSKRADHRLHEVFGRIPDFKDKLKLAIAGDAAQAVPSIGQRLDYFAGWLDAGCLVVRFEDLVGETGGGDEDRQRECVRSIYHHVGLVDDGRLIEAVSGRLFSADSPTFRKGAIGQWIGVFDDELANLFDHVVGNRAVAFGYPQQA